MQMSCDIGGFNVTVESGTCDEANNLYNAIWGFSVVSIICFSILAAIFIFSYCCCRKAVNENLSNIKGIKDACKQMFIFLLFYVGAIISGIIAGALSLVLNANISEPVGWMIASWVLGGFSLSLVLGWLVPCCLPWCLKNYSKYTNLMNTKKPAKRGGASRYRAARFDIA